MGQANDEYPYEWLAHIALHSAARQVSTAEIQKLALLLLAWLHTEPSSLSKDELEGIPDAVRALMRSGQMRPKLH